MSADQLSMPKRKISRAKEHLGALQESVQAFLATKPYKVATRKDVSAKKLIYYLSDVRQPDPEIALMAGEVIQDLRSALDYLAYQLVVAGLGSAPTNPRYIYYPIADSETQYLAARDRKVKGMSKAAIAGIDATKPYKGGNEVLWRISELNNVDKHRLLITVGSAFQSVDVGSHMSAMMTKQFPDFPMPELSLFLRPADRLFPLNPGVELLIDSIDNEVNEKMQFRFNVAFGEAGVMDGEPMAETIQEMIVEVERIVLSFEKHV